MDDLERALASVTPDVAATPWYGGFKLIPQKLQTVLESEGVTPIIALGQDFDPTQYRMLLFGLAMVVLMIWKPRGLISTREPSIILKESKAISGTLVKEGHG